MMRIILFLFLLFSVSSLQIRGQSDRAGAGDDILTSMLKDDGDRVHIELDTLLLSNYYKLLTRNREVQGVPGYRIRIFSESGIGSKEEAQRVRARFISLYPDVDAYYDYDEPYFKVYVGDCRTRSEALKLYDRIKPNFPNPILREDMINID